MSAAWLVEQGIGEDRALLIDGGTVLAAQAQWRDRLLPGEVADAVLIHKPAGARRGTVHFAGGELALIDRLPAAASEGAALRVEVTRAAIAERGRGKLAQARPSAAPIAPAPALAERLAGARIVRRFPEGLWDEVAALAWSGELAFAGGTLSVTPTPAMTLIDIDGTLPGPALARAAVPAVAQAIRWLDLGGSIGIDFPTLDAREDRRMVDTALGEALAGWPHERTAMNGFGFVQLVARLTRPSLLHLAFAHRPAFAARLALRRAERLEPPGQPTLALHPAARAAIAPAWLTEIERRLWAPLALIDAPALALDAAHAQVLRP